MESINGIDIFSGRTLVIATRHNKEQVIAPLFTKAFGVTCEVVNNLNTDQFGTFSGEINREGSPLDTARKKALAALQESEATLAIASEGSFGSHPSLFFIPTDEELLLFIDLKENLEIVGWHITEKTNYAHKMIATLEELRDFIKQVGFPDHGIIIKWWREKTNEKVNKGPFSVQQLENEVQELLADGYIVQAETDMRALHNPTRMLAIEQATIDLIERIKSQCPKCQTPGFGTTSVISGLQCSLCRNPTRSIKSYMSSCLKCGYVEETQNREKEFEEPLYCDFCNP
jgi:hypothetical protein